MVWNTNDWNTEEEDRHWEMTEEDTDDEFDDQMLARLGVELPKFAKEPPRPRRPQHQEGVGVNVTGIMETFDQLFGSISPDLRAAVEHAIAENDFVNEPPRGIDPVLAGFEGADDSDPASFLDGFGNDGENIEAEDDHSHLWDMSGTDVEEFGVCAGCGNDSYDCMCDDDFCEECGNLYEECTCVRDEYEYEPNREQ